MLKSYFKLPNQNVRIYGYVFPNINGSSSGNHIEDPVVALERIFYGHPLAGVLWERQLEKSIDGTWLGKSTQVGMLIRSLKTKVILIGLCG